MMYTRHHIAAHHTCDLRLEDAVKYYALDLVIRPQRDELTLADTARNMWNAAGRPQVTVKPVPTATELPVFRFSSLDLEELRVIASWYTGEDPEETSKLMTEVWEHGA